MTFKGVVFDLDGTLIDSKADLAHAMNRVLLSEGFPIWPVEKYAFFVGKGIKNLVLNALPYNHRDDKTVMHCKEKIMTDYGSHYLIDTHIYTGILDLLEYIKKQNLKSIVFSNKPDEITQKIIKQLFINHSFDFVLGASEALPTKPQPNGIFYICSKLGLNPTDLLYIGDSDVDMITAKNAGMKSIGATWGFRTENELINSGAWKIAHHPNEIINFL